jgi:hypothetical protein
MLACQFAQTVQETLRCSAYRLIPASVAALCQSFGAAHITHSTVSIGGSNGAAILHANDSCGTHAGMHSRRLSSAAGIVAVGISGGVDSAVAALLLQRQGYQVVGVFMRNWDEQEEVGNENCSVERDRRDAAAVCRQLRIPLHEADFVSRYWNSVFTDFVEQCGRGLTPNPDLACNRHIKFDALLEFACKLGADQMATGA